MVVTDLASPLGAIEIVRTLVAFALFLFLPGWLFITTWLAREKKVWRVVEIVAASVFASIVFLSLIASVLAFTVGVSFLTVLACEIVLIGVLWFVWRKKK